MASPKAVAFSKLGSMVIHPILVLNML